MTEISIPVERGVYLVGSYGAPLGPSPKRRTAIFLHGFAAERTENGLFPPLVQAMRERGYATFCYDWRGLGASGGDFGATNLDQHLWDFHNVLDRLVHHESNRPDEICAIGFSLGATIIVASALIERTIDRAVLLSPALRPSRDMWPRYAKLTQFAGTNYVVKPESDVRLKRPILESLRDTDFGESGFNIGIPVLVCHGTTDTRIPINSTQTCMRDARPDLVTAVYFEGASHSFRPETPHRGRLQETVCDWLARDLTNGREVHPNRGIAMQATRVFP